MKKILILGIILISCKQESMEITNNKIGNYSLGQKTKKKINDKFYDITLNDKNKIISIIYRSKLLKTKGGFGVGSKISELEKQSNSKQKELNIKKGTISIGNLGKSVLYDGIMFVDENNDNLVDFVWIQIN
jgi:hypothetical protein